LEKSKKSGEFYLAGIISLGAFVVAIFPIANYDLFWHLAFGKVEFLKQKIISEEIFSHTMSGSPWHNHTWLTGYVFFLIYKFFGYKGLIIFKAVIVSLIAFIMTRFLKDKGRSFYVILPLVMVMTLMGIFRYTIRPHIFTYLFLPLTYFILHSFSKSQEKTYLLFSLPVIAVVWVNLHSGVMFGIALMGSFIVGEVIKYSISTRNPSGLLTGFSDRRVRNLLFAFLGFIGGCVINPYGVKSLVYLFSFLTPESRTTDALKANAEFLPPGLAQYPLFWTVLTVTFLLSIIRIKKVDISELLVMLPFALLAMRFNRAIVMFSIIMLPVMSDVFEDIVKKEKVKRIFFVTAIILLLGMVSYYKFFQQNGTFRFGFGLNKKVLPVDCVEFVKDKYFKGNMYNTDAFGGYISWMLYPERKIFLDGRTFIFGKLYKEMHGQGFLEKYGVNYALVRRHSLESDLLFPGRIWKPVFWDRSCIVYVKKVPENSELLLRYGLDYFMPEISIEALKTVPEKSDELHQLIREIENHLTYVDNLEAFLLLSELYKKRGYVSEQERLSFFLGGLQRWPDVAEIRLNVANAYYKLGDRKSAREFYEATIKLKQFEGSANLNLGFIAYDEGRLKEASKYFKKSLEYDRNLALAYYGLSLVYQKNGKSEETAHYLKEYLKRASDDRWKKVAEERLKRIEQIEKKR
jgi:tetratricopeptide (TPR) repeat protein